MEPAKIDWSKIESVFVVDQVYEDINAPKWLDLSSPPSPHFHDDVAWFCRPDCDHPRTAEDFLNSASASSGSSKLLRSVSVSGLVGLVDWTRREPSLKKRGGNAQTSPDDDENRDPNFMTPNRQIKASIKSSAQKHDSGFSSSSSNKSKLKPTHSAKDLFGGGGKELVEKFTELCNDLKKMVSRPPLLHQTVPQPAVRSERTPFLELPKQTQQGGDSSGNQKMASRPPLLHQTYPQPAVRNERTPFLELPKGGDSSGNQKPRKNTIKRPVGDAENIPVNILKGKQEEKGVGVRTNPPTPQGISGRTTPRKGPKSRLMEREIQEEVNGGFSGSGKEGRRLDMFWFLKPCTLST